ncbi:MAG: heavy-metal-associated domain-containing protein [Firmicutes bacterium]|uniref:Heavy-metal-associated domain-containing protein n=1 Tax=Candidatus Onthovivens merdipullorum TaxID=2840889 RepID=A0A9D9DHG5_9BACL|nr:heavy-metal-associated domain-containing protein [Candidatus Onthovivens merdipullorum]
MEKVYLVNGLDCANCANQLEGKISKTKGVNSCSINFMTSKMFLDYGDNEETFEKIKTICSKFEDGVTLRRIK